MTTIHDSGVRCCLEEHVKRNALHLIAAAVAILLIIAGCRAGTGSPAGTDDSASAPSPPTAMTPPPTHPTPTAQPSPTPIDTSSWVPFSSDRFGYDMAIPPTWTATPAVRDWSLEESTEVDPGADHFIDTNAAYPIGVQVFSAPVPANMSSQAMDRRAHPAGCDV